MNWRFPVDEVGGPQREAGPTVPLQVSGAGKSRDRRMPPRGGYVPGLPLLRRRTSSKPAGDRGDKGSPVAARQQLHTRTASAAVIYRPAFPE